MLYGLIIAAGNQTRFKSDIPKSLWPLKNGFNSMDINTQNLSILCNKVFSVVSNKNKEFFTDYNCITIESGLGCGDAIFKALDSLDLKDDDTVIIQWGDVLHVFNTIFRFLYRCDDKKTDVLNIAVEKEKNPYVAIFPNKVLFSKYGETVEEGFHDLSLFYGNAKYILNLCKEFRNNFFNGQTYNHIHGNEFNFLDVINDIKMNLNIVELHNVKYVDYNTIEEFNKKMEQYEDDY